MVREVVASEITRRPAAGAWPGSSRFSVSGR